MISINSRKWRKFRNNPKQFFIDSKFNIFGLLKKQSIGKALSQSVVVKQNVNLPRNINNLNLSYTMLKPLNQNFDFDYLIKILDEQGATASYIKPVNHTLKSVMCVLETHKETFLKIFLNVLFEEGINIAYKLNGAVKKPKNVQEFWSDIANLKNFDVRLNTNRTLGGQNSSFWFRLEFLVETDEFILFPTANHISRKLWKHTISNSELFKNGVKNYESILPHPFEERHNFDVDLVFTWVNSDDLDWQKMYAKYKPDFDSDATSTSRFLSRDELKYALRSWEKYGSFIRKIFIVSNCAPPSWLDLSNPNIEWIWHEQIMPKEVLPTFSSHAIETSLFRIPGLANHWIYSNDDFLLVRPLTIDNFFYHNGIAKLRLEPWGNVNGEVTEGEPDYLNGARNANTLLEKEFGQSTTQLHTHSPQSMRIDVLQEMYDKFGEHFDKTMSHKFRTKDDVAVTGYFYHHYAMLSGRALQSTDKTELVQQNHDFKKKLNNVVKLNADKEFEKLPVSVCINDGADSHLNEAWNVEVMRFLDSLFPQKSQFEK